MNDNKILVVNAGSSSIKFQLFDYHKKVLAKALCERIFVDGFFKLEFNEQKVEEKVAFPDHHAAVTHFLNTLKKHKIIQELSDITLVGHRVVQGANYFKDSVILDAAALAKIKEFIKLAPLHNKPEADVIEIFFKEVPSAKNVAVFDTTFHTTIPQENYLYAVPRSWEQKHLVRRYGFHGTSYKFINNYLEKHLNKQNLNLIVCHLGNGASVCAIKNGKSFNTSMGFTPLEGLIMGTRSGDLDPAIIGYVAEQENMSASDVVNALNKKSGMLALTGASDMRDVFAKPQENAVAIKMYVNRVADYIAKYLNQLEGNIDGLVFTGGIGENASDCVELFINAVKSLGFATDLKLFVKYGDSCVVSTPQSKYKIYRVRTNEELMIVEDSIRLTQK